MKNADGGNVRNQVALHPLLSKVRRTILRHGMLAGGETVVVAVSGGPDSMALLRILEAMQEEMDLRLVAAHFNHGLRGEEGDGDEGFVRQNAEDLKLRLECGRADIPRLLRASGRSAEDLCRRMRYDFLHRTAERFGAQRIALGHHLQDQAETVLMNLIRGCGPRGLRGMQPLRDARIIRPLLESDRNEILRFLRECGIRSVTDSSNDSDRFLRNRLRKSLLPAMRRFNPKVDVALVKTAEILRNEDLYLQEIVDERLEHWGVQRRATSLDVPLSELRCLPPALGHRILKELLERMAPERKGIGYAHVLAVADLISQEGGPDREAVLPHGILARCGAERGILSLTLNGGRRMTAGKNEALIPLFEYRIEPPTSVRIAEADCTLRFSWVDREGIDFSVPNRAYMDYGRIDPPLVVRNRRRGDRFQPFGTGFRKKLQDFFVDMKVPRRRRNAVPLVADRTSVLWVAPFRAGEKIRITGETRRILMVEMI